MTVLVQSVTDENMLSDKIKPVQPKISTHLLLQRLCMQTNGTNSLFRKSEQQCPI